MSKIIQFPKCRRCANFYKFLVRWTDGAVFQGDTLEECFRKQKDVFEPEITMDEYMDRFRQRLENVTNTYYDFRDVNGLVAVLIENEFLEVTIGGDTVDEDKPADENGGNANEQV